MSVPVLVATLKATTSPAPEKRPASPEKRESKIECHAFVSLPFLFGGDAAFTSPMSSGFFWGWRPEVLAIWRERHSNGAPLAFGVGGYADVVGSTGTSQVFLGTGATIAGYFGRLGVALSAGFDADWFHAVPNASVVFGGFIGFRSAEMSGVDLPFGVRVDVHPATSVLPTTVIVSAQLDLFVGFALLLAEGFAASLHGFD